MQGMISIANEVTISNVLGASHVTLFFLQIVDAIISHGCFLRECSVQHSIIGVRSRLESGVELTVS
jgi:ADP-glucose pyrophosphorylase